MATTGAVEVPVVPGAGLDSRSLSAFSQLIDMWGNVIFPALAKLQVDPRRVRQDDHSRRIAERAAAEWTEGEGLRFVLLPSF